MDFGKLKKFTRKMTGQPEKAPAHQGRPLDQSALYPDNMNAKHPFPSSFTHLNRTAGTGHHQHMD